MINEREDFGGMLPNWYKSQDKGILSMYIIAKTLEKYYLIFPQKMVTKPTFDN